MSIETGSITISTRNQWRWDCTVQLLDAPWGRDKINPLQTRFKIEQGLVHSAYEKPEWVQLGRYAVTGQDRDTLDGRRARFQGKSYEHYLIRSSLVQPRTLRAGPASTALEGLIREVLPAARVYWDPAVDQSAWIASQTITDRWAAIEGDSESKSIAQALAARVFHDADGNWRVMPVASLEDAPTWEAIEGEGGVQLSGTESLTSEGVGNVAVVYGTPSSGAVLGPFIAKDTNPASLTYVGRSPDDGGFGEVPINEYRTPFVTSNAQGMKVAQSRLAQNRGLRQQLGGEWRHNPLMRPDTVGSITSVDGPVKCILDSVVLDLSPAPGNMRGEVRVQSNALDGSIVGVDET